MQAATQTPGDIVTVIQSVIVLFIAAPPLVRSIFRLRPPEGREEVPLLAHAVEPLGTEP
jgi:simple sugar transport system permease protein